ncbi:MAG: hypothetical protein FWC16_00705 [Defluviitaleaceae bacterium]|nr:hypothetical protein [Defluviitaleaceae bacterium]MCL2273424.1 hypothetical protein [Defluviitaleaceae bacterium]
MREPERLEGTGRGSFFVEGKKINEVSGLLGISVRSVSKHFNTLPNYKAEVEKRKQANKAKRKEYWRLWQQQRRADDHLKATKKTMKLEHITAVKILSKERFFRD